MGLLIVGNALFVLGEFALVTVDRATVEQLAADGDRGAARILSALRRLSFELSSAQLGITLTSIVLGFVAEPVIARLVDPVLNVVPGVEVHAGSSVSVLAALALATATQMVVGELVPKSWAIARPLETARFVVPPFAWFAVVFGRLIGALNGAANVVVHAFGVEPREELTAVRSLDEFGLLIRWSAEEGELDAAAFPILSRALTFAGKTAAHALVPRGSVVGVHAEATVADVVDASLRTGHSRFPVHAGDLDDVIGAAHVKDAFTLDRAAWATTPVADITQEVPVVPESRDLGSLLTEFTTSGRHLAVVVDEHGGMAGVLTLEDVLEEIVGEIEDEYDPVAFRHVSGFGAHVVAGLLTVDELEERVGFRMPEGDYETLGGFLLATTGRIPEVGDRIEHGGWVLEVAMMDGNRVDRVRVLPPTRPTGPPGPTGPTGPPGPGEAPPGGGGR